MKGGTLQDLERMIAKVKKETGWRDIHKIVDEALKRIKKGEVPEPKFITSVSERLCILNTGSLLFRTGIKYESCQKVDQRLSTVDGKSIDEIIN